MLYSYYSNRQVKNELSILNLTYLKLAKLWKKKKNEFACIVKFLSGILIFCKHIWFIKSELFLNFIDQAGAESGFIDASALVYSTNYFEDKLARNVHASACQNSVWSCQERNNKSTYTSW